MYALDSEIRPTLGGSRPEANLLERLVPAEVTDWTTDLLAATTAAQSLAPNEDDLGLHVTTDQHELNTPTIELSSAWSFGGGIDLAATAPAQTAEKESVLAELTVSNNSEMDAEIELEWGNLGSPGELLTGVCPMDVEGKVDSFDNFMYATTADAGGSVEISQHVIQQTRVNPTINILDPSLVVLPVADAGLVMPQAEVAQTKVESPPPIFESGDLLKWLDNDKISEYSEMPGEVKVEEEQPIPTTVNQVDLSDILPSTCSQPMEIRISNSVMEEASYQPTSSTSRKRSRNLSVASTTSSNGTAPKRGRGRPPRPLGRAITPAVVRGRIVSAGEESDYGVSTDGNLTETEISDLRYRRMRDLNNEASKRCRENRKRKYHLLEEEAEELMQKNIQLKAKLKKLERVVMKAKNFYIRNLNQQPVDRSQTTAWPTASMETLLGDV